MTPEDEETWNRALLRFRQQKDDYFVHSPESPLNQGSPARDPRPLNYFDPDPAFRFEVRLRRYDNPESVIMTTSKGTRQLFNKVGFFEVGLAGENVRLQAYQSAERDDPHLFIPFRDSTSGKETYGAARYLDINVEHDDDYVLDFNLAYNPYCAYNDGYVCPLPPAENWLKSAIRAGERKYHD